jgi:hypothetical protein
MSGRKEAGSLTGRQELVPHTGEECYIGKLYFVRELY